MVRSDYALVLMLTAWLSLGCDPSGSGGGATSSPSTTTVTIQPGPTTTTVPQLTARVTCTATGTITENQYIYYSYTILYVDSTYADNSTSTTCSFSGLSVSSTLGTCAVPVDSTGLANADQEGTVQIMQPCGFGTAAGFIYGLSCPANSPYAYSFHVQALPGEGWAALNPVGTITMNNCVSSH